MLTVAYDANGNTLSDAQGRSLGIRALVNSFYGVATPARNIEIANSFFHLKDFPNEEG